MASKLAAVVESAKRDIDALRDRIAELRSEADTQRKRPASVEEIEHRADGYIAALQAEAALDWYLMDTAEAAPVQGLREFVSSRMERSPAAVLATLAPDAFRAALLANIRRDGISAEDRAATMARIERNLVGAEIAEELACREFEQVSGARLHRRSDVDPAILLAPTGELLAGGAR